MFILPIIFYRRKLLFWMKKGLRDKSDKFKRPKVTSQGDLALTGRLWWVASPQTYNFSDERFLFALSKPCS